MRNLWSSEHAAALSKASPASEQPALVINPATVNDPSVRHVGLDVHKKQITYCILDLYGATIREGEIMLTREQV
ncbi:MAG: hypothetical protein KDB01_05420 [Planctomycetaceae bacterium]|nr:hypothetical protein [Planctomycetaceae bacterium]